MDERDPATADPGTGPLIDQLEARGANGVERRVDVVRAVSQVMHPGAPALDELGHRTVAQGRLQELHVGVADSEQGGVHAKLRDPLAVEQRHPEVVPVKRDGLVHVFNGDADVIDLA